MRIKVKKHLNQTFSGKHTLQNMGDYGLCDALVDIFNSEVSTRRKKI